MVPDYGMISEIILYSFGYTDAKKARKHSHDSVHITHYFGHLPTCGPRAWLAALRFEFALAVGIRTLTGQETELVKSMCCKRFGSVGKCRRRGFNRTMSSSNSVVKQPQRLESWLVNSCPFSPTQFLEQLTPVIEC